MTTVHEAIAEAQDAASALTRDDRLMLIDAVDSLIHLTDIASDVFGARAFSSPVKDALRDVQDKLRAAVA